MAIELTSLQEEAVRENLKNVVLFMASSGYLVSPKQEPEKEELWTETWKRIDRFLPELRSDLALEEDDEDEEDEKAEEAEGDAKTAQASVMPAEDEKEAKKPADVDAQAEAGA